MKTLFLFLILNCSLLIGTASAQWWVDGGNAIWPHGNVSVTNGIFKAYNSYSALVQDNGLHFFGNYQSAPAFSSPRWGGSVKIFEQLDEPINSFMTPLSVYGFYKQKTNSSNLSEYVGSPRGLQLRLDTHLDNKNQPSGIASGIEIELYHNGNYDLGFSHGLRLIHQILDTGNVGTHYGIFFDTPWGTSIGKYQNYYALYSKIHNTDYIAENYYHFYGEGDAPSYFGGAMIQKVYTHDVSNPPSRSELESLVGIPEELDPGYNIFIDDNGEGTRFFLVVSDGQRWWVFTASAAP